MVDGWPSSIPNHHGNHYKPHFSTEKRERGQERWCQGVPAVQVVPDVLGKHHHEVVDECSLVGRHTCGEGEERKNTHRQTHTHTREVPFSTVHKRKERKKERNKARTKGGEEVKREKKREEGRKQQTKE